MPKKKKIDWLTIQKDWELNRPPLKELAEKHGVSLSAVKSRKAREGWGIQKDAWVAKGDGKLHTDTRGGPGRAYSLVKEKEFELGVDFEEIDKNEKLTERQKLFCLHYLKSYNQTASAIKAGYPPSSAYQRGYELVRNRDVADEIARLKSLQRKVLFVEGVDVLDHYMRIAFSDITDFMEFGTDKIVVEEGVDEDGFPRPASEYHETYVHLKNDAEIDGSLIQEIRKTKDGVSVKLHDKMKAMEFLTKHLDLLGEKTKRDLEAERLKVENAARAERVKRTKAERQLEQEREQLDIELKRINLEHQRLLLRKQQLEGGDSVEENLLSGMSEEELRKIAGLS